MNDCPGRGLKLLQQEYALRASFIPFLSESEFLLLGAIFAIGSGEESEKRAMELQWVKKYGSLRGVDSSPLAVLQSINN
jgi:hypothetical protein